MPDDYKEHEHEDDAQQEQSAGLQRCVNCNWWLQALIPDSQQAAWSSQGFNFGECRACSPTALPTNRTYESAGEVGQQRAKVTIKQARFPHTFEDDWCGMWKLREKNSGE